jgi:hypothetical protein
MEKILAEAIPDPAGDRPAGRAAGRAADHASAPSGDRRPAGDPGRAWAAWLMAERRPEAEAAFAWLESKGAVTPELRDRWVDYLVRVRKDYARAVALWAAAYPEPGYPEANRIFDGRFRRTGPNGRLGWVAHKHPHAATKTGDGLTVTFDGKENTSYNQLTQETFVPEGRWRFSASAEDGGLTTDQRPYFRIYDTADPRRLDASTPMAPEPMAVEFTSPPGGSWVTVALLRRQSEKFDNKIKGTLRVKEVRIGRGNGKT